MMKCPYCGYNMAEARGVCPECGAILTGGELAAQAAGNSLTAFSKRALVVLIWVACWLVSTSILGLAGYRAYLWYQDAQFRHKYISGEETAPALDRVVFEDGRPGHAITFFGEDGDIIYIPQLSQSYMVFGGVTRAEIADSDWFDLQPTDIDSAEIVLTPMRTSEDGTQAILPPIEFSVKTPSSPLTVLSPAADGLEVFSSIYPLKLNVVPRSRVWVDGSEVTDQVNKDGELSVNVKIIPIGENYISVLVETPHHRETRKDVMIFRKKLEINVEISIHLLSKSSQETMTVSGTVDPTAELHVESLHTENSVVIDPAGNFSFIALFPRVGDNEVKMRAVKEGCEDAIIAFTVTYVPSIDIMSRKAWKLGAAEYAELLKYPDMRLGKIYRCLGELVKIFPGEPQILIMNVGDAENARYIALENQSSIKTPVIGLKYDAYADAHGRYIYEKDRIPYFIARYMYER